MIIYRGDDLLATADGQGGLLVPEIGRRIYATCNGGVFSCDGVHPSTFAHMIIAKQLAELMRERAGARETRQFGGVSFDDLDNAVKALINPGTLLNRFDQDPVIRSARQIKIDNTEESVFDEEAATQ